MSPIDCQQVLKEIELYLDGELEGPEHLEMCAPCMDHSEFKRHVKELLRSRCGCDEVPPALMARIREMLGERSEP